MKRNRWYGLRVLRRDRASNFLLIALVAYAVSVIVTRVFLELTGYPQLGNSVLHIAHALWGGLLMIVAIILPLIVAGQSALHTSALLGGVGVGLFIDEIGKFITQANDYFFAPSLSLIYGFFLLLVLLYALLRRTKTLNSRQAVSYALEGLEELTAGDLDAEEAARLIRMLEATPTSDDELLADLAQELARLLAHAAPRLPRARSSLWRRLTDAFVRLGRRLGHKASRGIVVAILIIWLAVVAGYIVILLQGPASVIDEVIQWRWPLISIQAVVGILMLSALVAIALRRESLGLNLGVGGFLFSLVALQVHYFYISQFAAITSTLIQFVFLMFLVGYRRWHL
ncbi:MAG: hypothetical protein PVI78_05700, partial [Anaerolineales bacterium]